MAFVSDVFTDTSGTLLASHTGGTGATWTTHPSYANNGQISSANRARPVDGNLPTAAYYAGGAPAGAEYDVQIDVFTVAQSLGSVGPMARVDTAAQTFYLSRYIADTGGRDIIKCVAGTFTTLGSFAGTRETAGTTKVQRLECTNATKKLFSDGVEIVSSTDNAITAAGKAGLWLEGDVTDILGVHVDNFSASDIAAAPTLVGAGTADFTATSGAALAPGLPTGWVADDIHILIVATSSNIDIPEPSGWTKLSPSAAAENNTTAQRVELWWRRAVAGDTAPSVAAIASTAVRGAQIYGVRGCSIGVDPFSATSRSNNAASATVATASATPADGSTLGLFLYAYEDDPSAGSQPTDWSAVTVATSALGTDMALGFSSRTLTTPSAQSPSTVVSGGTFANSPSVGVLLFLKPAVVAGKGPPIYLVRDPMVAQRLWG
jgi:hypothetical protein